MHALAPTSSVHARPAAPIALDVTVPKLTGIAAVVVRGVLGIADLSAIFDEARVGDVHADGPHHATFRIVLEPGDEVGRRTKAGLVAVANIDGQVRVTLPGSWGGALRGFGYTLERGVDETGAPVVRIRADAEPGSGPKLPLPVGRKQGAHIAVRVAG